MISLLHSIARILHDPKMAIQYLPFDCKHIDDRSYQTRTAVSGSVDYDPKCNTANVRLVLRDTSCIWSKGFRHD
jgi:hypothetical protein